jgi:hypothetical protein
LALLRRGLAQRVAGRLLRMDDLWTASAVSLTSDMPRSLLGAMCIRHAAPVGSCRLLCYLPCTPDRTLRSFGPGIPSRPTPRYLPPGTSAVSG